MRTGRWRTIQTAFSRRVAELRRLLIEPERLAALSDRNRVLILRENERHYLRRVLRLRVDDPMAVIDGCDVSLVHNTVDREPVDLVAALRVCVCVGGSSLALLRL